MRGHVPPPEKIWILILSDTGKGNGFEINKQSIKAFSRTKFLPRSHRDFGRRDFDISRRDLATVLDYPRSRHCHC